jgi:hypothetical protein
VEVYASEQWVMVRAEDPRSAVTGVLVESMNPGMADAAGPVADQKIVEHQPGHRVECVPPIRRGRGHAKGEAGVAQEPPSGLVATTAKVQIGPEDDGIIRKRLEEMACLLSATSRAEPLVSWWSAGIEVGAYQPELMPAECDSGRDSHPSLQHQGELNGVGILQRQRGQDRVPPVALQQTVSHGWCVSQVETEGTRGLDYVFLEAELCNQYPAGSAGRDWGDRGIATVGFLDQYDERGARIGAVPDKVSIPDPGYNFAQPPPSDPDIPAEDHQAWRLGVCRSGLSGRSVEGHR